MEHVDGERHAISVQPTSFDIKFEIVEPLDGSFTEEKNEDKNQTRDACPMSKEEIDEGKDQTEGICPMSEISSRVTCVRRATFSKEKNKDQSKSIKCSECNVMLAERSLKRHMLIHKKGHLKCPSCPSKFQDKWHLNDHLKMHQQPLVCHICGKNLFSRIGLKIHVKQHNSDNPIKCDICDKTFSTKQHFEGHRNSVHLGYKPYKCQMCGKAFSYQQLLSRHTKECRISKDSKGFSCDQCEAVLQSKRGLTEHIQGLHADVNYRCNCGKLYRWKKSYRRHIAKCIKSEHK